MRNIGFRIPLTKENEQEICRLYKEENKKIIEIGKIVGRDKSTVLNVLKKYNLYVNPINYMSEKEWGCLVKDYKSGMTSKDLSIKYNRSSGYIINKLKSAGIYNYVTLRLSDVQLNEIIELYKQGLNDVIFEKYPSLTLSSLYSRMSKLKIKSGLRNYWSKEDAQIIKDNYLKYDIDTVYKMIDGRHSKNAILDFAIREYGYSKSRFWTEEENKAIENYSNMSMDELHKLIPNRSEAAIHDHAVKNGIKSQFYLNTYWNNDETDYLLDNWNKMSDYEIGVKLNKSTMSVKERRNLLGLYRINKNKQGYTTIKNMLRGQIWNWKKDSIKACNYQCVLTGSKNFHIHHLISFSEIFNNYQDIHPLKSQNIKDYTQDEIDEICQSFVKFHDQYPLGVCVHPDLHTQFHTQYGKSGNTPKQWQQFIQTYKNQ